MIIRYIDNEDFEDYDISIGSEYKVLEEETVYYKIEDDNGNPIFACKTRFEIVKEREEVKMKCVNNKNYEEFLTVGKIYDVTEGDGYELIGDNGLKVDVLRYRFEEVKELTLQEVFNYQCGSIFKMRILDEEFDLELSQGDLSFISGMHKDVYISEVFTLKMLIEAKFYLLESWKEIDYYTAYTTSNSNIKYIHDNEEIIGTHYGILSNLDARCRNTGEDLVALLSDAKWYAKEE